ncbi:hypothetical protein D3C75_1183010 [compost metagenome]
MQAEQALQLPPGHLHCIGQHLGIERLLDISLHLADHLHELLVADAVTAGDLHALVVLALANAPEHELLGYLHSQLAAMGLADQVKHQVD